MSRNLQRKLPMQWSTPSPITPGFAYMVNGNSQIIPVSEIGLPDSSTEDATKIIMQGDNSST
jgi:hypothetical protein